MKMMRCKYFFSVGLRGLTLLSKFVFIILLAHLVPAEDMGVFGLINGAVGYAIFAIGFEFYTFSTREIINSEKTKIKGFLKNQILFYLLSYTLFIPLILLVFYFNLLPENTMYWFFILLFFEHISQEVNRVLITLQKQLLASFILFIRQGGWCWFALLIMFINPDKKNFEMIFICWAVGTALASIIGVMYIIFIVKDNDKCFINLAWIKKGFMLSLPMLAASLSIRGVFTFDRFAVEKISGLEVLGSYTLFISMTSAIQSFLDTILISFSFPKIAELAYHKKYELYFKEIRIFSVQVILLSLLLCLGCWICGFFMVAWIGKIEYSETFLMFELLIIATFIYCLSIIPHLALYALRADKEIVRSQIITLIVFCIFVYLAIKTKDIYFIPIGMITSFIFLFIWKMIAFIKVASIIKLEGSYVNKI